MSAPTLTTINTRQLTSLLEFSNDPDWHTRSIAFVFRAPNLLPPLSAERNVEIPLLLTNQSRYERRRNARATLDRLGLLRDADRKAGELSPGQQTLVSIARALVTAPRTLICDDVTADLEARAAREILAFLEDVNRGRQTRILLATHDAAEHPPDRDLRVEAAP
jgi:putative ABC transport system ATP-binding protein